MKSMFWFQWLYDCYCCLGFLLPIAFGYCLFLQVGWCLFVKSMLVHGEFLLNQFNDVSKLLFFGWFGFKYFCVSVSQLLSISFWYHKCKCLSVTPSVCLYFPFFIYLLLCLLACLLVFWAFSCLNHSYEFRLRKVRILNEFESEFDMHRKKMKE